jgi:hypothetical protein
MTRNELNDRIYKACRETTRSRQAARNQGVILVHWLVSVTASDRGIHDYASAETVTHRRRVLRRAGLAPVVTAADLADVAEALGLPPEDRPAFIRLVWTLRGPTGRLRFVDADRYFAQMIDDAIVLVRDANGRNEEAA